MKTQFKMETFPLLVVVISLLSTALGAPSKVQASIADSKEGVAREAVSIRKTFNGLGKSYVLSEKGFCTVGEARAFCQQLNGDLASNLNIDDFDVLDKNLLDLMCLYCAGRYKEPGIEYIWVGIKRDGPRGPYYSGKYKYKWITGESIPSNFERWETSEPSGSSNGVLWKTSRFNYDEHVYVPLVVMMSDPGRLCRTIPDKQNPTVGHALCQIH